MTSNLQTQLEERRTALNTVLQSKEFSRAPALAKLLKYLCEKTFQGRENEIKEFSIATEVYGRSETFGERRDSVVRVEVSRLRKRLVNYYAEEGLEQPLRIVIPAGTYAPEFDPLTRAAPAPAELRPAPPGAWRRRGPIAVLSASLLVVAAVAIVAFRAPRPTATSGAPG